MKDIKVFDFKDEGPDYKYVMEHLVITDGAGNSSRSNVHTTDRIIERSRVGNYHLNIISISIATEHEQAARKLVTSSRHAHYYPVEQFEQGVKDVSK